jgi:hypothetical protein
MTQQEREEERSVALLAERVRRLPGELTRAAASENVALPLPRGERTRFVVSGIGASEAPARLLAATLGELGLAARFVPVSGFLGASAPVGDVLVVVSQQLSPNASLPLRQRSAYAAIVLLTALTPERDPRVAEVAREGGQILVHPPVVEDELLLRVLGPAAATLAAAKAAVATGQSLGLLLPWAGAIEHVPAAVAAELAAATDDDTTEPALLLPGLALVCGGGHTELLHLPRGKLIEGLGLLDPPIWDACGVVHGPFQAFFERRMTLLYFSRQGDEAGLDLRRRLARAIVPERHRLWAHEGTLPGPLLLFEHDAAVLRLVLHTLTAHPRNLIGWPGQGADEAVYSLCAGDRAPLP